MLGRVLNGFYQYQAAPGNWKSLKRFRQRIRTYWQHVLRRGSQMGRASEGRMTQLADRWLPQPRLVHPYPELRFTATHLR